ncbi:monosaccharide ABC transporter membrane protein, CUT2 family [Salinihabitans flavidus]|uniref:Monosaccharide ABC transporter membrane protein, CUT2 family n=1 Tax=Salinihabitans flavidus TaxID=569882 RepID=A0A1H8V963_9RHOB|nr:ABC transporter permease [Salinihabitans flavidus]SEP11348.1 monosaccharide ABC transporter membrane protein, CUT2 family [Salinihabitans flavidus]
MLNRLNQERIVLLISVILFIGFSVGLDGFLSGGNILSLVQNVSILGILGTGMAIGVIGRGIDLSMVSTMVISVAWMLVMVNDGTNLWVAFGLALGFAVVIGLINGVLIAYVEIPAIFATLAMGVAIYGFGKSFLVGTDVVYLPQGESWFYQIGSGRFLGIPNPVIAFALVALIVHVFLQFSKYGRYNYAIGDNLWTARITGIPVRPVMMLQYVLIAVIALLAGVVIATSVSSMNTRLALSTQVYDVILVVVLGGIGLSGGKGGVRNVIVGTLLIGILLNGMTILNLSYTAQNIFKSIILLAAIVIDTMLNPRDEQTAQHGDI